MKTMMMALVLLAGCTIVPSPEQAAAMSDKKLCLAYTVHMHYSHDVSAIRRELDRRGLETQDNYCVRYQKY